MEGGNSSGRHLEPVPDIPMDAQTAHPDEVEGADGHKADSVEDAMKLVDGSDFRFPVSVEVPSTDDPNKTITVENMESIHRKSAEAADSLTSSEEK